MSPGNQRSQEGTAEVLAPAGPQDLLATRRLPAGPKNLEIRPGSKSNPGQFPLLSELTEFESRSGHPGGHLTKSAKSERPTSKLWISR